MGGGGELREEVEQPATPVDAEPLPHREVEPVGQILDPLTPSPTGVGDGAVRVDPATSAQPSQRCLLIGLGPGGLVANPVAGRPTGSNVGHHRLAPVEAFGTQRDEVVAAAVLAQQRAAVPQAEVGRLGPRERRPSCVDRAPDRIATLDGVGHEAGGFSDLATLDLVAVHASQSTVHASVAGFEHGIP